MLCKNCPLMIPCLHGHFNKKEREEWNTPRDASGMPMWSVLFCTCCSRMQAYAGMDSAVYLLRCAKNRPTCTDIEHFNSHFRGKASRMTHLDVLGHNVYGYCCICDRSYFGQLRKRGLTRLVDLDYEHQLLFFEQHAFRGNFTPIGMGELGI